MESVQKARSTKSAQAAQRKSANETTQGSLADRINNSPMMVAQRKKLDSLFGGAIQRVEDDEPLQGKFETAQRMEEEEPLQGKFETAQRVEDEEPLQGKFETAQRAEEEEPLQGKFEAASSLQRKDEAAKPNNTGLPDNLKGGIESLSGLSMDNVKVHYNSSQPAQLNAHAYAQGTDIHVAPGQEQHLPHEAWHVVQQAQGRVRPTMQMKGDVPVNDDEGLEREADVMGARAIQTKPQEQKARPAPNPDSFGRRHPAQRKTKINHYSYEVALNGGAKDVAGWKMEAWLDPAYPIKGSQPAGQESLRRDVERISGADPHMIKRGHLLNHDLGGRGVAENLYPITQAANTTHKEIVESAVAQHLYGGFTSVKSGGSKGVYYRVFVETPYKTSSEIATKESRISCYAEVMEDMSEKDTGRKTGVTVVNETIISYPAGDTSEVRGRVKPRAEHDENPPRKWIKPAVPSDWKHHKNDNDFDINTANGVVGYFPSINPEIEQGQLEFLITQSSVILKDAAKEIGDILGDINSYYEIEESLNDLGSKKLKRIDDDRMAIDKCSDNETEPLVDLSEFVPRALDQASDYQEQWRNLEAAIAHKAGECRPGKAFQVLDDKGEKHKFKIPKGGINFSYKDRFHRQEIAKLEINSSVIRAANTAKKKAEKEHIYCDKIQTNRSRNNRKNPWSKSLTKIRNSGEPCTDIFKTLDIKVMRENNGIGKRGKNKKKKGK